MLMIIPVIYINPLVYVTNLFWPWWQQPYDKRHEQEISI